MAEPGQDSRSGPAPAPPVWNIALSDLDFDTQEQEAVLRVLRSKWISMGPETGEFEREFAAEIGVKHAVAVANGTAALHLSCFALGIGAGDEVIQPAVNFVAAANVTALLGARPVFCDIRSLDDPTVDAADARRRLSPSTKALIVMHYGGAACRMDEITAPCRERGIALIEDACHGVGGTFQGKKMGALGDIAAFSFFANKNMTTGEGGMVTTNRDEIAERVRSLRSHGMTSLTWDRHRGHARTYDVVEHGLNYRLDEIRAALGRVQLRKLTRNNERRRALAREYHRLFHSDFAGLRERGWRLPELGVGGEEASHHLMVALAPDSSARDAAADRLKSEGIQTSIHYPFIPGFAVFASERNPAAASPADDLPKSREFCDRVLTLPLHPLMSDLDVRRVVAALARGARGDSGNR